MDVEHALLNICGAFFSWILFEVNVIEPSKQPTKLVEKSY